MSALATLRCLAGALLLCSSVAVTAATAGSDYTTRQLEQAASEVRDRLQHRWFDIELVVFERLDVMEFNTVERLTVHAPRRWPQRLSVYADSSPVLDARQTFAAPMETGLPADPQHAEAVSAFRPAICIGYPEVAQADRPHPLIAEQFGPPLPVTDTQSAEPEMELETDPESVDALSEAPTAQTQPAPGEGLPDFTVLPATPLQLLAEAIAEFESGLANQTLVWRDDLTLTTEVKFINRRSNLRPLLHKRWREPVPERNATRPIWLSYYEPGSSAPRLQGFVGVSVSRYLHLETQLWYQSMGLATTPLLSFASLPPAEPEDGYFVQHESRRMRSGEIHYLDHPKLGVLVRITPVEIPDALRRQWLELRN